MRYLTFIKLKNGTLLGEVVRAISANDAITKSICTKDVAFAEYAYAHPLSQASPRQEDYRWGIRCSVTGKVTMSKAKPTNEPRKGHE